VLATWVVAVVALTILANVAGGVFKVDFSLPGSESQRAFDLLERSGFGDRTGEQAQVVFRADSGVSDPAVKGAIEKFLSDVQADVPNVVTVSPYSDAGAQQIAPDAKIAYGQMNFADRPSSDYVDNAKVVKDLRDQISVSGLKVELGGDIFAEAAFGNSEGIGLLLALVILLVSFGSPGGGLAHLDRPVRHLVWHRHREGRGELHAHARLHHPSGLDDRHWCGHRLCALYRDSI
jgi:RND superfamily putative drug exporter